MIIPSIIILIIFAFWAYKSKKNSLLIFLLGVMISSGLLVYPIYQDEEKFSIIHTLIYVVQSLVINEDFSIVEQLSTYGLGYQYFVYVNLLALPILLAGTIISLITKYVEIIKVYSCIFNKVHIFSELNDKSITLAEYIKANQKGEKVIFLSENLKQEDKVRLRNMKTLFLARKVTNINLNMFKKSIKIYEIYEDQDKSFQEAMELVEIYKDKTRKNKIEILTFVTMTETQMVIEELEKGNVIVNIVNEIQNAIYHLLYEYPLYENTQDNTIKPLVIGAGTIGKEVVKNITWCGQMKDKKLEINVVDKNKEAKKDFLFEAPELTRENGYNINFFTIDIKEFEQNEEFKNIIRKTNYIIIATGDDIQNIEIAREMRRYFLQTEHKSPKIAIWIENEAKDIEISKIKNKYHFDTFGKMKEIYQERILNIGLEEIAINMHKQYDIDDEDLSKYHSSEYNKKSSRAAALHIKYKLEPYFKNWEEVTPEALEKLLSDENIIEELSKEEHIRWLAYLRSEGYKLAKFEDLKDYCSKENKNPKNDFLRLHPALVNWEELPVISKMISEVIDKPKDFQGSTRNSIRMLSKVLQGGK